MGGQWGGGAMGRGGDHFDPPVNSKTKEVRKMKLCTIIIHYVVSTVQPYN